MDYLLGVDLGSTSLKAVVYDLDGQCISSGSRPTERFNPSTEHPEWVVWDPAQIWGGTAAAIREAVGKLDDPRKIRGLAVTGMGMDGVPIDAEGRWLYPFISWHDPRTVPQHAWWLEHVGAEKTFSIGGNPVWAINSALRILWMAEHEPEILRRTEKWLLIEDFLNFMLTGRKATDYSMASCTMLFDQRTLGWSSEMLSLSGIDGRLLAEPLPSGTPLGELTPEAAEATGLPPGTPVLLGGHDHLCGSLPVGGFRDGVALVVTGSWEMASATIGSPVLDDVLRRCGMTVQAHPARGKYTVWGGNVSNDMLEWYRHQFGYEAAVKAKEQGGVDWDYLMAEACSSPPGARRVMFLPHLSGSSSPVVDGQSLGAFVGLSNRVTRGDMLRAMVEGLNYQMLDMVTIMESGLRVKLDRMVAVGGATRNTFAMQNKADVLNRPITVPQVEEATPLGAAIIAGIGLGLYRDEEDACARVCRPGPTYEPDPKRAAQYVEWFQIYRDLYPALSPISHRLFTQPWA
jgi:xylulokinase